MKNLFDRANRLIRQLSWKEFAVLKLCLLALGLLLGLQIGERWKKPTGILAGIVFIGAYLPLMIRFLRALTRKEEEL